MKWAMKAEALQRASRRWCREVRAVNGDCVKARQGRDVHVTTDDGVVLAVDAVQPRVAQRVSQTRPRVARSGLCSGRDELQGVHCGAPAVPIPRHGDGKKRAVFRPNRAVRHVHIASLGVTGGVCDQVPQAVNPLSQFLLDADWKWNGRRFRAVRVLP